MNTLSKIGLFIVALPFLVIIGGLQTKTYKRRQLGQGTNREGNE